MTQKNQGDVKLFQTDDNGDIESIAGIITMSGGLEVAVYLSLFGGNQNDTARMGKKNNSWWGNRGEVAASQYRSATQNLLASIPATSSNLLKIQDSVIFDLAWLLNEGIASSVDVAVSIPALNAIHIDVIIQAQGVESEFSYTENWKALPHDIVIEKPTGIFGEKSVVPPPQPNPTPFLDAVLALNPFHYARLGDTAGTVAIAQVGADLDYVGAVNFNQPGLLLSEPLQPSIAVAAAARVTYNNLPGGGLQVPSGAAGWSFGCWFNPASLPQSFGTLIVDNATFALYVNANALDFYFGGSFPATTQLIAGNDYFGFATYDGNTTVKLYHDGTLENTITIGAGALQNPEFSDAGANNIGGEIFTGNLQELLIFNYELTSAEVFALYNAGL